MQSKGKRKSARTTVILAVSLFFCQPLFAQRPNPLLLQNSEDNREPISFMCPHHGIHADLDSNLAVPPSSAYKPSQKRHAYGFDQITNQGSGQVIAIVDAYDGPNIESELGVFDRQFGLPACSSQNGCFRKIYANGRKPATNANWGIEIALDVAWAHAIAPQAKIVLVESATNSLADLFTAVDVAVGNGASVVSMSWTAGEFSSELRLDNQFVTTGVTFLAASGDTGTGVAYPAASPYLVGAGGASLYLDASGN
jgi:subtilase family serine protease